MPRVPSSWVARGPARSVRRARRVRLDGRRVVWLSCRASQQGPCQAGNLPSVEAFPFRYRQRVRLGETDLQNVVYCATLEKAKEAEGRAAFPLDGYPAS